MLNRNLNSLNLYIYIHATVYILQNEVYFCLTNQLFKYMY